MFGRRSSSGRFVATTRAQVDEFKLAVSDELERLLRERAQHEERLRSAQEQLRGFRDRERAMNEALVAAQQLRVDSRAQAEREAELVVREAKTEAERIHGAGPSGGGGGAGARCRRGATVHRVRRELPHVAGAPSR